MNTRHDLEALLERVYVKCNPAKLLSTPRFVKDVVDKYEGYHDCLVSKLRDKYENRAPYEIQQLDDFITSSHRNGSLSRRNSREWASKLRAKKSQNVKFELLSAIYEKCNPEKLKQPGWLDSVVSKYDGYDDVLLQRLSQKYCETAPNEIEALRKHLEQHSRPKRVSQAWAAEARDAMKKRDEERKSIQHEGKEEKPIRSNRTRRVAPPPKPRGQSSYSELLNAKKQSSPQPFLPEAPDDYKERAMSKNTMHNEWNNLNNMASATLRNVAPPPPPGSPFVEQQRHRTDTTTTVPEPPPPTTPMANDDEEEDDFGVPPTPPPSFKDGDDDDNTTSMTMAMRKQGPPKPPPRGKIKDNIIPSSPDIISKKPSFASMKVSSSSEDLRKHIVKHHIKSELDEDARYIAMLPSDPSVGSFFQSSSSSDNMFSSASSRVRAQSRLRSHTHSNPLPMLPTQPGVGSFALDNHHETKASPRYETQRKFSVAKPHYDIFECCIQAK